MTNIIIIHGTGGNPNGNWFPWLKSENAGHINAETGYTRLDFLLEKIKNEL